MIIIMINLHYLFISNKKDAPYKSVFLLPYILTYIDTSYEHGKILYTHRQ